MTPDSSGLAMMFLDNNLYCSTLAILKTTLAILNSLLTILNSLLTYKKKPWILKKNLVTSSKGSRE